MKEELKDFISFLVKEAMEGKIHDQVVGYTNYKNKYTVLKPRVTVEAESTDGRVVKIDVTDYFEGVVK